MWGGSRCAAVKGLRRRRQQLYLRLPELQAISERLRAPARPGRGSAAAAGGGGSSEGVNPVAAAGGGG